MSEDEEEQIYCICKSSEVNRFMIGCDHCEEWYHGDCINVTAKDSKYIKKFYCKECTQKNPNLKVVYKSKYMDTVLKMKKDEASTKDKKEERKEKKEDRKEKKKEKKKHKDRDKERSRSRERHKHKDKKHKKDKSRDKDKEREEKKEVKKEKDEKKILKIISDSDEDMIDLKEDNKKDREEEIKIKEEKERKEKEKQREKEIEKERRKLREEKRKEKEREERRNREAKEKEKKEKSASSENKIKQESFDTPSRKPLQAKEIQNINKYGSEDEWKPAPISTAAQPQKRKAIKESGPNKRRRAWRPEYDSSEDEDAVDLAPRQCYGMECINCARVGSKYCSDQCGLTVASLRIYQTLPDRMREWSSVSCKAEEKNRKELEKIRDDIHKAKQRLEEVDKEAETLEEVIARGKTMTIIENKSDDSSEDEDESRGTGFINCITCGKDVAARTAIRHMESCFNKFESQTSFGSMYKTRIEGYQMFCDFYNPQTGTYCKRLRVICPEHTKDQKVSDTEVCGFPLTKDIFKTTGDFCRLPRRDCNNHFSWEKLKRAELDMDRVRQWLKLDELLEKERQEKESMSRRAGVLSLLLHSTYNHELAEYRKKWVAGQHRQPHGQHGQSHGQHGQSHGQHGQPHGHHSQPHGHHSQPHGQQGLQHGHGQHQQLQKQKSRTSAS